MIEINRNPSSRELRIFGGLCLLFFAGLGALILWRPAGLLVAAVVLGLAWLVSLAFNPEPRRRQLAGGAMPALFALSGGAVLLGLAPWAVAGALIALGLSTAALVWASPEGGRRLYVGWMLAAVPVGWTLSHIVLAVVYYLVLTPIGLALRLAGRDPMRRRFDREARTYWIERKPETDAARHFRQF